MNLLRHSISALAFGVAIIHAGSALGDETRIVRDLEKISSKENKLEQIDQIITQDLARRNSGASKYSEPIMKQIYSVRAAQCPLNTKQCLAVPWATWACRNQIFANRDLVMDLWSSILASSGSEKNAEKIWAQIKACHKSTTVMKVVAAQALVRTAHLKKWEGLAQTALSWLASNIVAATVGFGPAQGLTANEASETIAGVLADFADELDKWEPVPLDDILALATAHAQWLQKAKLITGSSRQLTRLADQTAMALTTGGRPLAVATLIENIVSTSGADAVARTPVLGLLYCYASWELNKTAECQAFLERMQALSPDIKLEVQMAIGLLYKGDPTASITQLNALMPKVKRTTKYDIALSHLYLAIAEHARGKSEAARTNIDLYFKEFPATIDPLKSSYAKAFELRLPLKSDDGDRMKAQIAELRSQIKSRYSGKPASRTWLEFNVLLAALRSKSSGDIASAAKFLRESLGDESEQGFYRFCLEALDLKQTGKDPKPALEKAAATRGQKYPDYLEFKSLLTL